MINKIKKIVKTIFGTENNILTKFSLSCFFTGILFFALSFYFQNDSTTQPTMTFSCISGTLLAIWLISIGDVKSIQEIFKEFFRLYASFIGLIFSLDFCLNQSINLAGFKLAFGSILSSICIFLCFFYFISKFIDILMSIKKIFVHFKNKLFGSAKPTTSKIKSLIENITAFLVTVAGLGVAIKTVVEPLIDLIK